MFEGRTYKQTGRGARSIRFADTEGGVATTTYSYNMSDEERDAMARRITASLNLTRGMTVEQIESESSVALGIAFDLISSGQSRPVLSIVRALLERDPSLAAEVKSVLIDLKTPAEVAGASR